MDALLYGITRSLDYLGDGKDAILERMGAVMLEYLVEVGSVERPYKPSEFARSLGDLLTRNGYSPNVPLTFSGDPPSPVVSNFVDYLKPGEGPHDHNVSTTPPKTGTERGGKIDWVLYEMAIYGMTKALDELGAQGQLMLNRIGTEMLNYLVEIGAVEPSDDPFTFVEHVKGYFMAAGFAKSTEFRIEGSPPTALVATWSYAPYYSHVLKRLRQEGSVLFSCPVCLASESIMSSTRGVRFQNLVELRFLPDEKVTYRHKIYPQTETFTEEEAQAVSQKME